LIKEEAMDIQLNDLIEKIKREGIESAQAGIAQMKAGAEAEAKRIIEDAKQEADTIITRGKEDAKRSEMAGIAAIEQASRNLVLAFKGEIQALLDNLTAKTVASSYSADVIKGILPDLIKNWAAKDTDSLTVLLSAEALQKLDDAFKSKLASALKGGVELKAVKKLDSGFQIVEKDGSAFYDFSAESVANMLSAYLNPKLAEILKRQG
jgi:V/A-type H+-transporting ATPase subunit E